MTGSDFWSRRRAAVVAEEAAEKAAEAQADAAHERAELDKKTDQEILAELDLPDPDKMRQGDDFSVFLKAAVPDRLKRRALRRLWASNPALANLDGLIDYGEDYTDAATVTDKLSTAYQVGKGMTKHVEEMLRQAADAPKEQTEADPETAAIADADGAEHAQVADAATAIFPDAKRPAEPAADGSDRETHPVQEQDSRNNRDSTEDIPLKPGRMRYHFDSGGLSPKNNQKR